MTEDYQRFLDSMSMDYSKWRDGEGYDLDALRNLSIDEKEKVVDILIARGINDWRDIDALAEFDSKKTLSTLKDALKSKYYEVRMWAADKLSRKGIISEREIETLLVETIPLVSILNGQTFTLRLAERYPTPAVKRMLLSCVLLGNDDIRVHAAALICYLYGIATSSFDWDLRPFYLRFGDKNLSNRKLAYDELCEKIQVDPRWAMDPGA
jgi:hypothetical protein